MQEVRVPIQQRKPRDTSRTTALARELVTSTVRVNTVAARMTWTVQGISHRHCTVLQHVDGYSYTKGGAVFPPAA